jgi:thioredoxin 1
MDEKVFNETIKSSELPVVVDFYADWCQPCTWIAPIVEEISGEYEGKAVFGRVNIDENQQLAEDLSIMSIPTVISFKNGEIYKQVIGAVPKEELVQLIA